MRASTEAHWSRFWRERAEIDEVYPTAGRVVEQMAAEGPVRGKIVLEVGAGSGRDSVGLAEQGAVSVMLDYSMASLQVAREVAERSGVAPLLVRADALRMPFRDGTFDAVFHQGLLEHFHNPLDLLRENARVLKRGGILLVDVPQRWHYYTPLKHALIAAGRWFAGWETEFTIGQLRSMVRAAGLRPEYEYGDWCVPNLFYRVGRKVLLKRGVRLPLQPVVPVLGPALAAARRGLARTALPLHTGMNIGCVARKD